MIDYTIYYKTELPKNEDWSCENSWKHYLFAYNSSERIKTVYNKVKSQNKYCLLQPEYEYEVGGTDYPVSFKDIIYSFNARDEADYIISFFNKHDITPGNGRICIDITGFIRPYMIFLFFWLKKTGFKQIDVIYAEPDEYSSKERTIFSEDSFKEVKTVCGFSGSHLLNNSRNILLIGAGYEYELIKRVAEKYGSSTVIKLFGFPSLQADMYQQNVLNVYKAEYTVGKASGDHANNYFAPANNPFSTASVIQKIVNIEKDKLKNNTDFDKIINLFLCPVSTKPQVLGFTLYYLNECLNNDDVRASLVYPFHEKYSKKTSKGISRIWKYTVEF